MGMTPAIDITAEQRRTVLALLNRHLPDTAAWVYGSRVKGTSRPTSDLDLVVFAEPKQSARVAELRDAFEESNLPFRVDLFVWDEAPESSKRRIKAKYAVLVERGVGNATDKRQEVALGELVEIYDGPHATPKKTDAGPIFLGISNLASGRLDLGITEHLSEEDYKCWTQRVTPESGDIVFSYETRLGEAALIPTDLRCCLGRRMGLLRLKDRKVDARFLLYAFLGQHFQEVLRSRTIHGSTVDRIPLTEMGSFPIEIPTNLSEQRTIGHILGTLDDKIELNRRMNETLEAMARALFNSWFVDFDPVRAKMEGRDTGLSKPLANLFPERMAESELGLIPDGWKAGRLADIATAPRRNVDPASLDDETPYIGLEHMPRRSIALSAWGGVGKLTSNKSAFKKGEILFGKLRPYFHKVGIAPTNGVCSTDIVAIASKAMEWSAFVLLRASSIEFINHTNQSSTGTKMPRTNWTTMGDYRICLPAAPIVRAFQNAVQPVVEQIVANVHESHTLAALRDTLLPKLISGEIRLRDAERQVEGVA